MTHSSEDIRLIEQAVRDLQAGRNREDNARLIYEKCYRDVFGYLLSASKLSYEDCEDITQNTFKNVYEGIAKFRGESSFITWMRRIALNRAIDELRRQKTKPLDAANVSFDGEGEEGQAEAASLTDPSPASNPAQVAHSEELRRALEQSINGLPPRMRQCLILREIEGRSYKEIALIMGIDIDTVKSQLSQGRKRLQEDLKDFHDK